VGLGNDLGGDVEVLSEVGETLVGEGVVVPLPRELGLDESLGGEGLHSLDDLEVSDSHVGVLGSVKVLGSDEDTLLEEVLVDLLSAKVWGLRVKDQVQQLLPYLQPCCRDGGCCEWSLENINSRFVGWPW
jgi:hypothetical protein